jgi:1-acyl-sn-glycerol-3-phosphate acyltransferase
MKILRSTLFLVIQSLTAGLFGLLSLLLFPLPPVRRNRVIAAWARFMMWLARVLVGIRYRVIGLENLPEGPAVILAKHQSAWETIAFQVIFPPVCFVLKRELLRIPFFGWGLAMTSPIAIDRGAGREALKQIEVQGKERLADGLWVVTFPEGTRIAPGQKGNYQIGGAWLAAKAGVPVVPVAHNAGRFWSKQAFIKHPGEITVRIGPVIATAGRKPGEINAEVEAWIEAEMARL